MVYNLGFITDKDFDEHVLDTVNKYRFSINFDEFKKNIIDPIKLTFDSKVYGKSIQDTIESEIIRQIDKSNTNHIGYFHQNIFKHIGWEDWSVPERGFDIVNEKRWIYVELKNKHNTMNSSSSKNTYMRMQKQIIDRTDSTCYLVEVIAKKSQDVKWVVSLDWQTVSNEKIRRMSMDKFYELVTGDRLAFKKVCEALPVAIDAAVRSSGQSATQNDVFQTLSKLSPNLLKSIYLLSFQTYEGFDDLNIL